MEAEKDRITGTLNELDNDIEIASKNIVHPGKKEEETFIKNCLKR